MARWPWPRAATATSHRLSVEQPALRDEHIIEADIQNNAPVPQWWISMPRQTNYLWAFGDGGGTANGCRLPRYTTRTQYEVLKHDIVGTDAQAVFFMLFGSYMGNWDGQDDLLRSVLATRTMGPACMMVGEPHWFVHHMALGETIGYGTRLTVNNTNLYQSASNAFMRAVQINLMGDPNLCQDPICLLPGCRPLPDQTASPWLGLPASIPSWVTMFTVPPGRRGCLPGSMAL